MSDTSKLAILAVMGFSFFVSCSKSDKYPVSNGSNPDVRQFGISCDTGYSIISTDSTSSIMQTSSDAQLRQVELKSAVKYGFGLTGYSLSENCSLYSDTSCKNNNQLEFNYGGDPDELSVRGHFIVLDADSATKFDNISLVSLDGLNLKTKDGTPVTRDTIFGNPSTQRKLSLGESSISRIYGKGSVVLALLDDTWSNDIYQLFKIRINDISSGESVSIEYQRIAEAPKSDLKNFYCSKQAEIKSAVKDSGEAIVYSRSYGSYDSSTFGFDYGVNGFDGRYVKSEQVMFFGDAYKCTGGLLCVVPHVGAVVDYWGGVIDLENADLNTLTKSAFPNLQSISPKSALMPMLENHTYLVSQLNSSYYTFGAVHINEIDPQGRWVKFNWKRISIEQPYRFVKYTDVVIPANEVFGEAVLGSLWWIETHLDVFFAKKYSGSTSPQTEAVYFDVDSNTLNIDNRYFPAYSGIVDVSAQYSAIESIPAEAAGLLVNQFQEKSPIRLGAIYIVATEKFWYKASLAIQVTDFTPGKSVKLKYKRLYNGQTFLGSLNK